MITVRNIRDTKAGEYIGRTMARQGLRGSPLGNPYRLNKGDKREDVIARYAEWLDNELEDPTSPASVELARLTEIAQAGALILLCWCAPLSCHGDVVKARIEARLSKEPFYLDPIVGW